MLRLKTKEGEFNVDSWSLVPFAIYHGLVNISLHFFLKLIRSTMLLNFYYKLFGLKIGRNTKINSVQMSDYDIIFIGDNCNIGYDAVINGHTVENGKVIRKAVRIGNNVTIGQFSIISPGVVIEDNVIVGANAVVPKNRILKTDGVYAGIPARRINEPNSIAEIGSNVKANDNEEISKLEEKPVSNNDNEEISKLEEKPVSNIEANVLLTAYECRHKDVLSANNTTSNIMVSALGLVVTIVLYGIINNMPKLLAIIPPLVGLVYTLILNNAMSLLKIGKHMYIIEKKFQRQNIEDFNWEEKEGILGNARAIELDNLLINIIFIASFLGGLYLTIFGNIFTEHDKFFGYSVKKVLMIFDSIIVVCIFFTLVYFLIKQHKSLKYLNEKYYSHAPSVSDDL